jgi:hypothetical protein
MEGMELMMEAAAAIETYGRGQAKLFPFLP